MIKRTYKIVDEEGLHARPASLLTMAATKISGSVDIEYKGIRSTCKSIMVVMSLGIGYGEEFSIIVEGENEQESIKAIEDVLRTNALI